MPYGTIFNQRILRRLRTLFDIRNFLSSAPAQPVIVLNDGLYPKTTSFSNSATNSAFTIGTAQADKDFYITGLTLNWHKNNTSDVTEITVVFPSDGVQTFLGRFTTITLSASAQTVNIAFPYPLKCDKGGAIGLTYTVSVGTCQVAATVYGFHEEQLI